MEGEHGGGDALENVRALLRQILKNLCAWECYFDPVANYRTFNRTPDGRPEYTGAIVIYRGAPIPWNNGIIL
jgi:hypothetical protein